MQLTSSNIISFSSKCFSSFRDSLCVLLILLVVPFWFCIDPVDESFCELMLRKVGVPSMVLTIGFNSPPRSNSWAEIFLWWVEKQIDVLMDYCEESNFNLYARQSITISFTWQEWLRLSHCVKNTVADSREWATRLPSSCRCQRWQQVMHEPRATNRQRFSLLFAWSNSERTPDSHRATTPCERIQHHNDLNGDLSWVGVVTDCFRAPNLCPPQRAFCFGAPLYSADAVLEGKKLNVNLNLIGFIHHSWCDEIVLWANSCCQHQLPDFLFFLKRQGVLKWHMLWPIRRAFYDLNRVLYDKIPRSVITKEFFHSKR